MGIKSSKINDEFIKEDIILTNPNINTNINQKETIIFSSHKNNEIKEKNSYSTNLSITEELNKSTKMDSTFDNKNDLILFKFKWKDNDNNSNKEIEVMITGSFLNNWNELMPMVKNPETNIYEYETLLSRERHYFKYIINNKWLCSDLYKTVQDESNNINNYIDLTNYQKNQNTEEKIFEADNHNNSEIKKEKIKKRKKICPKKQVNDGYGLKYPLIKDLNVRAPIVMVHYKNLFLLDNIANQFFNVNIYYNIYDYNNKNGCYKKIFKIPHEKLEHITPNIEDIFSENNYTRFSVTERKRHKFLTFIYYKPKK